jgi:hypothetical protein
MEMKLPEQFSLDFSAQKDEAKRDVISAKVLEFPKAPTQKPKPDLAGIYRAIADSVKHVRLRQK